MALEDRGTHVRGTRAEIDAYRSQQADSQAGSVMAGTVAIAGIAVVIGVAALFVYASAALEDKARDAAAQLKAWHNMYSKLWGKTKADKLLKKTRKALRTRTLQAFIAAILAPAFILLVMAWFTIIPLFVPFLLAIQVHTQFPYTIPEMWYELSQILPSSIQEIPSAFIVIYLITVAILVPIFIHGVKKQTDIILLTRYNNLIYESYPKAKCPYCRKRARVLSLGQCRNCFKFLRSISYEDAKALSEYKMEVNFDVNKIEYNEFFSAEVGRTVKQTRTITRVIPLLKFVLPYALLLGINYLGALFLLFPIVRGSENPTAVSVIGGIVIILVGFGLFSTGVVSKMFDKISNDIVKRDVRKFMNAVKTELQKHRMPTGNWQ